LKPFNASTKVFRGTSVLLADFPCLPGIVEQKVSSRFFVCLLDRLAKPFQSVRGVSLRLPWWPTLYKSTPASSFLIAGLLSAYDQFSICASPGNKSFFPPTSKRRMRLVLFITLSSARTMLSSCWPRRARTRWTNQRVAPGAFVGE